MKKILGVISVLAMFLVSCANSNDSSVATKVFVKDYGVTPQSSNNHNALVKLFDALKEMKKPVEVIFEEGEVYKVGLEEGEEADDSKIAIVVDDIDNLTINGQGSTLLITNPEIGALSTKNCNNLVVKNFYIDYETLPYTQGIVQNVDEKKYTIELKLDEGFPTLNQQQFYDAKPRSGNWGIAIHDMGNGRKSYGPTILIADEWKKLDNGNWELQIRKEKAWYNEPIKSSGVKKGDPYIHMSRNYATCLSAVGGENIVWDNITIYSSPNVTFYPHQTKNHVIKNCHVRIKEGRIFSSDADGIHMRSSRGNVVIDACTFEGMADDGINLHSSALSIHSQPELNKVIVPKHSFSVRKGDELQLVRSSVAEIVTKVHITEIEDKGISWLLTLDKDLPQLTKGDGFATSDNLYNLSEIAAPFVIKNCEFKNFRGRGVLLSTHDGIVENNKFYVNEGWGVVFSYETAQWAEGPLAKNIVIKNNEFYATKQHHMSAIYGHIIPHAGAVVKSRPYKNITIEYNKFVNYTSPVVELHHAKNVSIENNQVTTNVDLKSTRGGYSSVVLKNCEDVLIENLSINDKHEELKSIVEIDKDCAKAESIKVGKLVLNVVETCNDISDKR